MSSWGRPSVLTAGLAGLGAALLVLLMGQIATLDLVTKFILAGLAFLLGAPFFLMFTSLVWFFVYPMLVWGSPVVIVAIVLLSFTSAAWLAACLGVGLLSAWGCFVFERWANRPRLRDGVIAQSQTSLVFELYGFGADRIIPYYTWLSRRGSLIAWSAACGAGLGWVLLLTDAL